jgi:hypothetical protein
VGGCLLHGQPRAARRLWGFPHASDNRHLTKHWARETRPLQVSEWSEFAARAAVAGVKQGWSMCVMEHDRLGNYRMMHSGRQSRLEVVSVIVFHLLNQAQWVGIFY